MTFLCGLKWVLSLASTESNRLWQNSNIGPKKTYLRCLVRTVEVVD